MHVERMVWWQTQVCAPWLNVAPGMFNKRNFYYHCYNVTTDIIIIISGIVGITSLFLSIIIPGIVSLTINTNVALFGIVTVGHDWLCNFCVDHAGGGSRQNCARCHAGRL